MFDYIIIFILIMVEVLLLNLLFCSFTRGMNCGSFEFCANDVRILKNEEVLFFAKIFERPNLEKKYQTLRYQI